MDYKERFRAAVRAALDEYERHQGKEDPTDAFLDTITEAAFEWASDYGDNRFTDGMIAEREVYFG